MKITRYLIIRWIFYRSKITYDMTYIPLHVRSIVTKMTVFLKLYLINYTIISTIPYCTPLLVVLLSVPIRSSSHILSVSVIKIYWVWWNILLEPKLLYYTIHLLIFNCKKIYKRNFFPTNRGQFNINHLTNVFALIRGPHELKTCSYSFE